MAEEEQFEVGSPQFEILVDELSIEGVIKQSQKGADYQSPKQDSDDNFFEFVLQHQPQNQNHKDTNRNLFERQPQGQYKTKLQEDWKNQQQVDGIKQRLKNRQAIQILSSSQYNTLRRAFHNDFQESNHEHYLLQQLNEAKIDSQVSCQQATAKQKQQNVNQIIDKKPLNRKNIQDQISFEEIINDQTIINQIQYAQTSRLLIQKEHHNLIFQPFSSELFIHIAQSLTTINDVSLSGLLLITNFRLIFFTQTKIAPQQKMTNKLQKNNKKQMIQSINIPYGKIRTVQFNNKRKQITFWPWFQYPILFYPNTQKDFTKFTLMLPLYIKSKTLKQSFAFEHALKSFYEIKKKVSFEIIKEYIRFRLNQISQPFSNQDFKLSDKYPQFICIPLGVEKQHIKSICQNYKGNRLPVLTFKYGSVQKWIGMWISGGLMDEKKINQKQLTQYLNLVKGKSKSLIIYDCNINKTSSKSLLQNSLSNHFINHFLPLPSNTMLKAAYIALAHGFITHSSISNTKSSSSNNKSFFNILIDSKWLDMVLLYVKIGFQLSQKLLNQNSILLKQDQNIQKSLIISSLVQLILEPYFRTFKGFQSLMMKQWICFGFKSASRLGMKEQSQQCPLLILFLDAVSQLIHLNPHYFQFNCKYLSKLSAMIYTNIYGTFLADSPKQFFQFNLLQNTVSIWSVLQSQLTTNPYYEIKAGILPCKPHTITDLRLWSQHFAHFITQPVNHYKIQPYPQSTTDYLSLSSLQIKNQNKKLKIQLQKQTKQINALKSLISLKKNQNSRNT